MRVEFEFKTDLPLWFQVETGPLLPMAGPAVHNVTTSGVMDAGLGMATIFWERPPCQMLRGPNVTYELRIEAQPGKVALH